MAKPTDGKGKDPGTPAPPAGAGNAESPGETARHDAQLLLGQLHGVLKTAVDHASEWCPTDGLDAVRAAYADVCRSFGMAQAALNSGEHDHQLADAGLSGAQLEPKRRGFREKMAAWVRAAKEQAGQSVRALKPVLRWGHTFISSLASIIPGAEAMTEFIEVIQNSIEDREESDAPAD